MYSLTLIRWHLRTRWWTRTRSNTDALVEADVLALTDALVEAEVLALTGCAHGC